MKQQKRIIQHLIDKSKIKQQQNNYLNQHHHLEQQFTPTNDIQSIQNTVDQEIANISVQLQPAFNFQIYVEIGNGRSDIILMNEKSNAYVEAEKFCNKHNLDKYIVDLLAQSLDEQARKQKKAVKQSMNSINNNVQTKNLLSSEKNASESKIYKYNKNSQQIWKEKESDSLGKPKINEVSEAIVQKIGKEKIIQAMNQKFHQKVQQHLMQQLEIEQRQFQSYSFHPNINPISRKVDQTLNFSRNNSRQNVSRYQHLHQQHKVIERKKQIRRRNSLMDLPFRPTINKISRTIMSKKRSIGELYPLSAGKSKPKSTQKYNSIQQDQMKKKKIKNLKNNSLNSSTSQLCYHLYQQAKKRQQKIKKQADRIYNNQANWKIIQSSNSLVNNLRENRLKQIFYSLTDPPHKILSHMQINFEKLSDVQKIFLPVFNQMKDVDTDLTEQQFVQAGLRLLKYISPNERSMIVRRNSHFFEENKQKQNSIAVSQINKKSREILKQKKYGQQNIYTRGLIFRKQVKNQIEKGKQQKVRKQLKGCTFKPKIHKVPQNVGY